MINSVYIKKNTHGIGTYSLPIWLVTRIDVTYIKDVLAMNYRKSVICKDLWPNHCPMHKCFDFLHVFTKYDFPEL